MGREMVPDSGKSKLRGANDIMKDPSMKVKLSSYGDEAVKCKAKIQQEQENIKAIREAAVDELGIKPAIFNAYVQMLFNNDYLARKSNLEELIDLVDAVIQDNNLLPPAKDNDNI